MRTCSWFVVIAVLSCAMACRDDDSTSSQRYRVRGVFLNHDSASGLVQIHHESIPGFRDSKGKQTGMMAMQKAFRVAPDVDLERLASKDFVDLEFVVEWDQKPAFKILKLKRVAGETSPGP